MEIALAPNQLCADQQTLTVDKVATLIGENGCGKSSILQSIFDRKLNREDYQNLKIVCFSSGQNENFSSSFSKYLKRERRSGLNLNLECFYYDKTWSKLLIFLATTLKRDGKVRGFLKEYSYITESAENRDDISTTLSAYFKVDKAYVGRVQDALRQEESGETETLRSTPYFRSLDSFITANTELREYNFDEPVRKRLISITSETLFRTSFSTRRFEDDEQPMFYEDPTISFFSLAADNDYFLDKNSFKLTFANGLELDQLSDGEYQLLFLYALIDLFDADNTLFLLDEADSHLHYKNVERLWQLLHGISGYAITTTHLLDSIAAKENRIEHLKVVEQGKINEENKIKQLINRLTVLSRAKSVEFEVCGKLPNIALLDDYNDWMIFTKLAERAGHDIAQLFTVYAMKRSSSYATANETFGKGKIDWLHGLSKIESPLVTTKIFLICDRDEAVLDWNVANGVQVNGQTYRDLLNVIQWPAGIQVRPFLLAWKRREIKNYLLSHTALTHHNIIAQINNDSIAPLQHLQTSNPGDNDAIRRLDVKKVINPLINADGIGLDAEKLQAYIDLIPPSEISEDITNMYNFIIGKL